MESGGYWARIRPPTMWRMGWVEVAVAVLVIVFGLYGWYHIKHEHVPGRDWWDGGGP